MALFSPGRYDLPTAPTSIYLLQLIAGEIATKFDRLDSSSKRDNMPVSGPLTIEKTIGNEREIYRSWKIGAPLWKDKKRCLYEDSICVYRGDKLCLE